MKSILFNIIIVDTMLVFADLRFQLTEFIVEADGQLAVDILIIGRLYEIRRAEIGIRIFISCINVAGQQSSGGGESRADFRLDGDVRVIGNHRQSDEGVGV